jgi:hypothetical protein
MNTVLQLLRIAVWHHPVQRALTLAGAALLLVGPFLPVALAPPGSRIPQTFFGASLVMITPILFGGLWWRRLSAPRILSLVPYGRLKLLLAAGAVALVGVGAWLVCYAYAFQVQVPAMYRPGAGDYLVMFVVTAVFATAVSIGPFIASHSPAAMLAALGLWLLPGHLLRLAGVGYPADLWQRPAGWAALAAVWVVFGVWYLQARRISPPGWLKAGGQVISLARAGRAPRAVTPGRGLDGLLLGGSTVIELALQWFAVVFVLLLVQALIAHYADSDPLPVVALLFSTLSLSAVVAGALGFAIAKRSRALWLPAGLDRAALYRRCEGLLLRACAGLALAFGLLFVLLWATLAPHPPWRWQYVLTSLALTGLAAAWLGLAQVRRHAALDSGVSLVLLAAWLVGTVGPLFAPTAHDAWGVLAAEALGVVLLRELSRRRWAAVDWPR